jgi:SnoaL-like domain
MESVVGISSSDVLEILALQVSYVNAVTRGNADAMIELYVPDAIWERVVPGAGTKYDEPIRLEGIDAIKAFFAPNFPAPYESLYVSVNPVVEGVANDRDRANGSVTLLLFSVEDGQRKLSSAIDVQDSYRRTDVGWRFARRSLSFIPK